MLQSVKEHRFSRSENWRFGPTKEEVSQKSEQVRSIPLPDCQLFQIHDNIFRPHPGGYPGQTSVVCISYGVLLFCIGKHTLNRFFSHGILFLFSYCLICFCVRSILALHSSTVCGIFFFVMAGPFCP